MRQPFRIDPKLPAGAMRTFEISAPLSTHYRPASCEEVECEHFTKGWQLRKEILSAELLYTVAHSGRSYTEMNMREGETWLVFAAGQKCFAASKHRVRLERPEVYIARDGDWRGNPRGTVPVIHSGPDAWVDQFATHQEKINKARE